MSNIIWTMRGCIILMSANLAPYTSSWHASEVLVYAEFSWNLSILVKTVQDRGFMRR